ncbi:MAG: hypothetical protein WBQ59_09045, partial [Candidatus Acidiferrum sp.]
SFHLQLKGGKLFCFGGKKIEEVPLRHKGDEFAVHRQVGKVSDSDGLAIDDTGEVRDDLVRQLEERFEQVKFVHDFECGGMNGVSTEITEEIGVFLEDDHRDARARQKIAQNHAGGATTGDAATRFERFLRSGQGVTKIAKT